MALLLFWLGALSSITKWLGRSWSDAITCITSRSTTGSRNAIRLCRCIAHQLSVSRPVMSWLSDNAVPSARPSASTSSARKSSTSKATSRRPSFSSEHLWQMDLRPGAEAGASLSQCLVFTWPSSNTNKRALVSLARVCWLSPKSSLIKGGASNDCAADAKRDVNEVHFPPSRWFPFFLR